MENLHLKNLNKNNIQHTRAIIKHILENIDIRHYKIEKFKQEYIEDLYNPLNDTEHLRKIGQQMIDIFEIIKDLQQNKQINDEILVKLEQINPDRIDTNKTTYYGLNLTEYFINYTKKKNLIYDKDYNEIGIDIDENNIIQSIYKVIK